MLVLINMAYSIRELALSEFPVLLKEIPDPPKTLFCAGILSDPKNKLLAVVGARQYTQYGKDVCEKVISGLRGFPITIVSGLALGIDSMAHRAALENNLHTIAVPGSGLNPDVLYPRTHLHLAEKIVFSGGALLSEFANTFEAAPWAFPKRNRIMAGMCHATLVIEAEKKSGTLITSRLATEYNRDVFTIPGSIFSRNSEGPHMLIRLGATPITKSSDILEALGFQNGEIDATYIYEHLTEEERAIVKLLNTPLSRDELIRKSMKNTWEINSLLIAMEIKGIITESMGEIRLS